MYRIWQVIYPIGIYYVVSSVVYFCLGILFGERQETYMLRQMVCGAATIPFILSFYRQDKEIAQTVYGSPACGEKKRVGIQMCRTVILSIAAGAMLGMAVNNLIAMTPLMQVSQGFAEANDAFFAGKVLYELLGSCLLIPIAEELLYRGVVFRRLQMFLGLLPAICLSAVIFGAMHVNLVQFLYAGILGLLLAYLFAATGKLYAPVLAHIAANTAAVVRQETGWLDFAYAPTAAGIGCSLLLLAATGGILFYGRKKDTLHL